ncbi:MAG: hypothetical protein M2R45_02027 [Verrucomicrobia subdivision 3 bacterium]|nr:hypothetical protein [Limisphaerales bacterium]MCS1414846.1 hypothetical protein [Limisphaerales bacterium]
MGLDAPAVKFLCAAKSLGVDFSDAATIGRQSFFPDARSLRQVFSVLGISRQAETFLEENPYSEAFFSLLGAREVTSVDFSDYEAATVVHNMNRPIGGELRKRFSVVHDGGTLEHVFHVTQALKNSLEMVRVGGHFSIANIANNFMGHGFWQFSPDLIFRVLSPENGYQIECVLLHEAVSDGAWYLVADPAEVRSRVELRNALPTYIMAIAERVREVEIFANPPQQSDYVALWDASSGGEKNHCAVQRNDGRPERCALDGLRRWVPANVRAALRRFCLQGFFVRRWREFNPAHYRRVQERDLLRGQFGSGA